MVTQLDTQLKAYEKKHSINNRIIKTRAPAGITFAIYMCPWDPLLAISEKPQQLSLAQFLVIEMWQSLLVFPQDPSYAEAVNG